MNKLLKSATLVAGLTLAGAAIAGGPDHMAPPPHMSAFYAGAEIGPSFTSSANNTVNLATGFDVGGHVGYRWNPHMRAEIAYNYWRHSTTTLGRAAGAFNSRTVSFHTLMGNVYYDANAIVYHLHPYVGVGVGWFLRYSGNFTNFNAVANAQMGQSNEFAYQGIAGLSYHVMDDMTVYAEYHMLSWTGLDGFWNAVNFGANYFFNF
ncbi:MAG: porin family protein [Gammaproteobacteria bacterium]|nr:porin family protein [Gammaproteobacteria bacterium]